jgi:hypothetical protein
MDPKAARSVPPPGPAELPWARSPQEIEGLLHRLDLMVTQIAARPGRTAADLSPGEHYAIGVRAAAQWTTGRSAKAPLTEVELTPDVDALAHVLALADYLLSDPDAPDQAAARAGGVRAWLTWLIGAEDLALDTDG